MAPLTCAGNGARKTPAPVLDIMRRLAAYLAAKGWRGPGCVWLGDAALGKLYPFAAAHHGAWERCSPAVRKLHARNVAIVGGVPHRKPVRAVICWTEGGHATRGTGLAIRLARAAA